MSFILPEVFMVKMKKKSIQFHIKFGMKAMNIHIPEALTFYFTKLYLQV